MTSFVNVRKGDYLYVRFPETKKDRRITITNIQDEEIICGALYDRSLKKYVERVIDISWITGIRILSSRAGAAATSVLILYEID